MAMKYIHKIKSIMGQGSSGLTLRDALFNPEYRRATWTNIGCMIFHELAGVQIFNLFSNTIFKNIDQNGTGPLTPRQGVYLLGLFKVIAGTISLFTVKFFKRKTLLILGHILIAVAHAGVAIFSIEGMSLGALAMVLFFQLVYDNSSGTVAWIYATETTIDAALGICLLALWGTVFMLSIVSPILMDPNNLGPNYTFFILSGISVFGALYMVVFLKETFGK